MLSALTQFVRDSHLSRRSAAAPRIQFVLAIYCHEEAPSSRDDLEAAIVNQLLHGARPRDAVDAVIAGGDDALFGRGERRESLPYQVLYLARLSSVGDE